MCGGGKVTGGEVEQGEGGWIVKGCLSDRGLTISDAKECVKDRREWRRIVGGGDVDDPG